MLRLAGVQHHYSASTGRQHMAVVLSVSAFAFIVYEDVRDAEDALHRMQGVRLAGQTIRVEWGKARNRGRRSPSPAR